MRELSYENSSHQAEPASIANDAAQQDQARSFAYPTMHEQQNPPKGAEQVPEAVRKLREADSDRRMFSPQKSYAQALPIDPEWPTKVQATIAELREVAADLGLSDVEARALGELLQREPASDEERAASRAELQRRYGPGADEELAEAQKLVARDPRFREFMDAAGWEAHPRLVMIFADKARAERARGRL